MSIKVLEKPEWHYLESGQQKGPITLEVLQGRIETKQLQPTDWVW